MRMARFGLLAMLALLPLAVGVCGEPGSSHIDLASPSTQGQVHRHPVTVADMIQMTEPGEPEFQGGMFSKHDIARFSPDKTSFLILFKRGNLTENTNEYWIEYFRTRGIMLGEHGTTLVHFASSSNRSAISKMRWLGSHTIAFLAENPGESAQIYTMNLNTRTLSKLTNSPESLTSYAISPGMRRIAFLTEKPLTTPASGSSFETVVQTQPLLNLLTGADLFIHNAFRDLYVQQGRTGRPTKVDLRDPISVGSPLSLSPDGRYLIVTTMISGTPPPWWREYRIDALQSQLKQEHRIGERQIIYQFQIVDLVSRQSHCLLTTPIPAGDYPDVVWSPDGKSVILSGILLPFDQARGPEVNARRAQRFVAELSIADGKITPIMKGEIRLQSWNTTTGMVIGQTGSWSGASALMDGRPVALRKRAGIWQEATLAPNDEKTGRAVEIFLEEGMNSPPKIFAQDARSGKKILVQDLNPQFSHLGFGEVRDLGVLAQEEVFVKAGIYLPVGYKPGLRYPLVIQTHEWSPERFWIDGPFDSAFAAQVLAGKGFIVAQVALNRTERSTPMEVQHEAMGYDAVIRYLDDHRMIDVDKMAIVGFSRSALGVKYALTHSKYHFSAATIADGSDIGYFRYIAYLNSTPWQTQDAEGINGGLPQEGGIEPWFRSALDFDLARLPVPIRMEAYSPEALFFAWELFGLRTRLNRPVDLIYLPKGQHVLVKPRDRMASQGGNVNWCVFWLQHKEDTGEMWAAQYRRWEQLKKHLSEGDDSGLVKRREEADGLRER
jgi:dipeptidyl aminopeptidase/acylaminoacyl peptidase